MNKNVFNERLKDSSLHVGSWRSSNGPASAQSRIYNPMIFCTGMLTGMKASRDVFHLVATLMVLFRVFGWTRRSTFAKSSLLSVLRSVAEKTGAFSSGKYNSVTAVAARYCIQVRTSAVSSPLGASVYTVSLGVGRTLTVFCILHRLPLASVSGAPYPLVMWIELIC